MVSYSMRSSGFHSHTQLGLWCGLNLIRVSLSSNMYRLTHTTMSAELKVFGTDKWATQSGRSAPRRRRPARLYLHLHQPHPLGALGLPYLRPLYRSLLCSLLVLFSTFLSFSIYSCVVCYPRGVRQLISGLLTSLLPDPPRPASWPPNP